MWSLMIRDKKFTPTRLDNSDVKFLILNWYNRNNNETGQNDNVSTDDALLSSSTSPVAEGDPPSSDSSH